MRGTVKGHTFDSHIRGETLTLELHVVLVPAFGGTASRPPGFRSPPTPTLTWPPELWRSWPTKWKEMMLEAWHKKFELRSAGAHLRTPESRKLECHLDLHVEGIDSTFRSPGHLRVRVDYFGRNKFAQSAAFRGGHPDQSKFDMVLDYRDILQERKGIGLRQRGAIHEFGHHLGLAHRCDGTGNGYCGGVSGVDQSDVMASGDTAKPWHAEPWLRRLRHHRYHSTDNWWAVVVGGAETSGHVQPSDRMDDVDRQNLMKETPGLTTADVDSILAPPPTTSGAAARPRPSFIQGILAALGLRPG